SQKVAQGAFGQVSGKVVQLRFRLEFLRVQGNDLLKPSRTKRMVAQAYLRRGLSPLEAEFQGLDETDQQRSIQKTQVVEDPVPPNVARERLLDLGNEHALPGTLSGVSATETEDLFQQFLVSLDSPRPHPQVVLDCPLDDRLIQVVGNLLPR